MLIILASNPEEDRWLTSLCALLLTIPYCFHSANHKIFIPEIPF